MLTKQTNGVFREYPVTASFCGVGFEWVQFNARDFEKLLEAPDLRAAIENIACRMEPSDE